VSPGVSLIVRFRNEARYLDAVLRAVRAQRYSGPIEVVAVDNRSNDDSRVIAERYADRVLDIDDYRPGAALNKSVDACTSDYIAVLSAHALPANEQWLGTLLAWLRDPELLGVYGAQIYPLTARFLDKRDLDIFSAARPRTELADSDFWNANSAFHRTSWEKQKFNETVIELEDHYWTKQILAQGGGQWVRYEPRALAYHYGHDQRNDRSFLPPSDLADGERIDQAIAELSDVNAPWPVAMSAGLTLGSLSRVPGIETAVDVLTKQLREHPDFDVRWRMAAALGRIGTPAAAAALVPALADPSYYPRDEAAWALARIGERGVAAIRERIAELPAAAQPFAALALGRSGTPVGQREALDVLANCLSDEDGQVRRDAVYFLGEVADAPRAADLAAGLLECLEGDDYEIARGAAWAWGKLAEITAATHMPDISPIIELARRHPDETARIEAVVAIGRAARAWRSSRLLDEVSRRLCDGSGRVRYGAMQSLRLSASDGAGAAVEAAAEHQDDTDFGVLFERELILEGASSGA
jgi:HEAT repeat protein